MAETRDVHLDEGRTAPDTGDDESGHTVEAATTSPLRTVRDRIDRGRKRRFVDLPVPFVDGYVVRYRAVREEKREDIVKKRRKAKDEQLLLISADILISCCVGIFDTINEALVSFDPNDPHGAYVDDDGNVVGDPLTFSSSRTAELVGAEGGTAVNVVRAFYTADGDIIAAADAVVELSGYVRKSIAEDELKNL